MAQSPRASPVPRRWGTPTAARATPSPSSTLLHYSNQKEIAVSSYSSVYSADWENIKVALKYHKEEGAPFGPTEYAILSKLQHQHIVELIDYYPTENCLVIEFLEGQDLYDWSSDFFDDGNRRRPAAAVELAIAPICRQIHAALVYCHACGVAHRDLKLENIMIDRDEKIKLIDFGMGFIEGVSDDPKNRCGSVEYAAPELIDGSHLDEKTPFRADAWSFGVVIYALAHYLFPYAKNSAGRFVLISPSRRFSAAMRRLLRSLLTKNPHTRSMVADVEMTWLKSSERVEDR